ncbi:hypothetical protein MIZ03_3394 [Rhodoferax lithotrophicus]|uniref:Uncharacterized protein n=1 Tax=Rhodoferax lithotrophicus TaxID=2798804 RepID=A0ABM7MQ75_9BURK|nr:hypothetical protein MIZ03_3394 [Rhodoferax sp. MIZ03]
MLSVSFATALSRFGFYMKNWSLALILYAQAAIKFVAFGERLQRMVLSLA